MTRSIRSLTVVNVLWALGACHDGDDEPNGPEPSAPVYPVIAGDAGHAQSGVDAGLGAGATQGQADGSTLTAGGGDGGEASPQPDQLPCEVASFLMARCQSCHGAPPLPGIPMSLATYADLALRSRAFPSETHAQRALARIQMGSMPPGGGLSPAEVALFAGWVQAGAQPGSCGSGTLDAGASASPSDGGPSDAASPLDAASSHDAGGSQGTALEAGAQGTALEAGALDAGAADASSDSGADAADAAGSDRCSSGQHWDGGLRGSVLMAPGKPCLSCHAASAPLFSFAGTIFPSAHEPDDCFGAVGNGVAILIKGANGQRLTITPNAAGNFIAAASVPTPYTVEVTYQGRTRAKAQPQTSGDCNSCHSQQGTNGAAGRITLP
jgi:hypothetical protein